jgi:hypothetical protein
MISVSLGAASIYFDGLYGIKSARKLLKQHEFGSLEENFAVFIFVCTKRRLKRRVTCTSPSDKLIRYERIITE